MANERKMAKVSAILALREQGWSCRRIGRELGVHRETVARYLRRVAPRRCLGRPHAGTSRQTRPLESERPA